MDFLYDSDITQSYIISYWVLTYFMVQFQFDPKSV